MTTAAQSGIETEVSILARFLDDVGGWLPEEVARYVLDLKLSEKDKARMHDLAVRNQDDALTPAEREEMHAFAKDTTLISVLKSRARRTLGVKLDTHPAS